MSRRKPVEDVSQLTLPAFIHSTPVIVPQGNGDYLVRSGKPVVCPGGAEVTTAEFARLTGLSARHIQSLCDEGHIQHRRKSPLPKSEYLIPLTEVARYRALRSL